MIIVRFVILDISVTQLVINSVMIQNCTKQNVLNILLEAASIASEGRFLFLVLTCKFVKIVAHLPI